MAHTIESWMKEIDAIMFPIWGMCYGDLPDLICYFDSFAQGVTPLEFVEEEVLDLIADELGTDAADLYPQ